MLILAHRLVPLPLHQDKLVIVVGAGQKVAIDVKEEQYQLGMIAR